MKRSVFFVLFVFLIYTGQSQNLVVNPGLESWESSAKPSGWSTSTKCLEEITNIHSGLRSCRHAGSASSRGDLGQMITVIPGKTYTLSVWYMTGTPTTGMGARVWCYWKDAGGASITDPATDALLRSGRYLSGDTWTLYSVNVTAPETAVALYLEVRTYINSITYWDDFVFEEYLATGKPDDFSSEIKIYPVPATNYLRIENINGVRSIEILDLTGHVLRTENVYVQDEVTIPVNGLKEGIYILRLKYERNTVVRKFMKR